MKYFTVGILFIIAAYYYTMTQEAAIPLYLLYVTIVVTALGTKFVYKILFKLFIDN